MNTWITSDTHFGHNNIIKFCARPFKDAIEMDEHLILNWNRCVRPDDIVIHLGDFSMSEQALQRVARRLNGRKFLILGNHDYPHPAHKKGRKPELQAKYLEKYKQHFEKVDLESSVTFPENGTIKLAHLPYTDPNDLNGEYKVRHAEHRLPDEGMGLWCGHVHEKWLFRRTLKGTPMLNVGIDAPGAPWSGQYRPASIDEVLKLWMDKLKTE